MRFAAAERLSAILYSGGAGALTWINISRTENNHFGFCAGQISHFSEKMDNYPKNLTAERENLGHKSRWKLSHI